MARPIYEIANEIERKWAKVNYAARPYLDAMKSINDIGEMYYYDSAKSVVLYFMANAHTWRGEDARRIKAELKGIAA